MRQFVSEVKQFGWSVALKNALLLWTMDRVGAKKFKVTYK